MVKTFGFKCIDISSTSSPEHDALGPMSLPNKTFVASSFSGMSSPAQLSSAAATVFPSPSSLTVVMHRGFRKLGGFGRRSAGSFEGLPAKNLNQYSGSRSSFSVYRN